jgi:RNA polymerase sigma-70 factor (ECF subfamily)
MSEASDAQLLDAHVHGSPTAFGELVRRHRDRLWLVAMRTVGNPEDAEDVVQDAVLKAFRNAATFRGEAAVSTWLHRIVVTTALDALRARSRRPTTTEHTWEQPDPRDQMGRGDRRLDVRSALQAVPEDQRMAVVLVDMIGLSVSETASILEVAPGTVKSRCFRARARLAALLDDYAPVPTTPTGNRRPDRDVQPGDENESTTSREGT